MGDGRASNGNGSGIERPTGPPFRVTVGVTGHRRAALPDRLEQLHGICAEALTLVRAVAETTFERERPWFAPCDPRLTLLSPLAEGADQIAAEVALDLGFDLHVILGFERGASRSNLPDGEARERFDALAARAARLLELPGQPEDPVQAYVMTGRATVAHSDILLAVWDGEPPRGRGGTALVVELALRRGVPVIHVDPKGVEPTALLWSGFDPSVVTEAVADPVRRPFDAGNLASFFDAVIAPPTDADERGFLKLFSSERLSHFRGRIEYPLLLAAVGVAPFDASNMRESYCAAVVQQEWDNFQTACVGSCDVEPYLDLLGSPYAWSDRLATRFAQTYRSGHIFNFLLGGTAVCVGLVSNIFSQHLLFFALAEAMITAMILTNTRVGVGREWHRRWLDYRQLAERLRPMRSFKLLALAAPDPPGSPANPTPRRWMEWFALATWRAMGCPSGRLAPATASALARSIATHELAPQIAYHRRHAQQIELLDHRLERISATLFWVTLLVSLVGVAAAALRPDIIHHYGAWLTLAGAGFPALGTAVFGVRFQADFGGSAVRSQNTANALRRIEAELALGVPLGRAAELAEEAGRVMIADLDEWRLVNQQQELDLL